MTAPTLLWLRNDLRLADNPALRSAVDRGEGVVVLYVFDEVTPGVRPLGGASRWWLHHSLAELADRLAERGGRLVLRRGAAADVVPAVVAESRAGAVTWNRRYGRGSRDADAALKTALGEDGLQVESFQANLLVEPWTIRTGSGTPYQVFTPFWRACLGAADPRVPVPEPREIAAPGPEIRSEELDSWELLPTRPDWAGGLRETWVPGEVDARRRLEEFADGTLAEYGRRDEPAQDVTSHLSPSLAFGEISPFQIWHRLHGDLSPAATQQSGKFLSEVGWREFHNHVAFHAEDLAQVNVKRQFDDFGWERPQKDELDRWRYGRTGFPLVDAGMRELWHTGYMHNRVRMVAASFLVKNLLVDWRVGEQWFWDTLVDADEANNPGNWQWVAGSGADASPYFRIFNPLTQQKKFDPDGAYVRRWVPEAGTDEYPDPMVDLGQSRRAALDEYEVIKRS
ncbi:cryptochrome/photolyase family protein [Ruania halotolerans]|uniref:cryptochrome/photolyase family protein n=1 Tax=Ruania halotolerans TaxID=2897773 RepID=UPI001E340806|nr:deoxyribodipyrimidine photo-lyase [Ruania halotolerans]UFU06928.1 DNA photolyase family protein [Ruania halotolerans]